MNSGLFSIGQFSKITGLTVKTLRFYHEKGILVPARTDDTTGYRYYDGAAVERARVVVALRDMEFSIDDISEILKATEDEADLLTRLELQKVRIAQRMRRERQILRALEQIIANERQARDALRTGAFTVEEKTVPPTIVAGLRLRGKYSDCGKGFSRLGRALGRHISGHAFCLYYDAEYKDEDADIETCFPIRKELAVEGVSVRVLPGMRCLSLVHRGPYTQLGRSYEKILRVAEDRELTIVTPIREVYVKGPGMIFRGNPKNYLTEIQLPLET